jgi:tRNA(Ile)-lysidine synthase
MEWALRQGLSGPDPGPGALLVAVSGGGDSVALLRLLLLLAPERGWRLTVGHVDHGLRPDSAEDARFVAELAASLGLPCFTRRVDIFLGGLSPEEAARLARRQALKTMAAEAGAGAVALAHTADDQAETLLLRVLNGTGPTGLAGMRPWSPPWWRPLLTIRRQSLREWLLDRGQPWHDDPSNADLGSARNRLRALVMPLVAELINPRAVEALGRLAGFCAQEEKHWRAWCAMSCRRHGWREGTSFCLNLSYLMSQGPAARRRLLRHAASLVSGRGQHLLAHHVEQTLELATGRSGRRLDLPGTLSAHVEAGCLRLDGGGGLIPWRARLDGPGWAWLPSLRLWLAAEVKAKAPTLKARGSSAWMLLSEVAWPLTIRPPRPGERLHPLGAPGAKRLSRFLMDLKVPKWWRERTVAVADARGLLWAAPWSVDERVRTTGSRGPWLALRLVDRANPRLYTNIFKNNHLSPGPRRPAPAPRHSSGDYL